MTPCESGIDRLTPNPPYANDFNVKFSGLCRMENNETIKSDSPNMHIIVK